MIAKTINPRDSVNRPARTVSQITEKPDILISKDTSVPNVVKPDLDIPLIKGTTDATDQNLQTLSAIRKQRTTRFSR